MRRESSRRGGSSDPAPISEREAGRVKGAESARSMRRACREHTQAAMRPDIARSDQAEHAGRVDVLRWALASVRAQNLAVCARPLAVRVLERVAASSTALEHARTSRDKPARTRPGRVGPMSCVAPAAGRRGGGRPPHLAGEGSGQLRTSADRVKLRERRADRLARRTRGKRARRIPRGCAATRVRRGDDSGALG